MTSVATSVLATIGAVGLSALTAAGLATWLFKTFSDKWLSNRFNESLEAYKHEHQRELEKLRYNINALMDRTSKLHHFEFEVLPEIWAKLNEAFGYVIRFVSRLQTYPDLNRMGPIQLEEFLDDLELKRWEREEVEKATDKTSKFMEVKFRHDLVQAEQRFYDFNNYFIRNRIFILAEMKGEIEELRVMMDDALFERRFENEHPNPRPGRFEKCDLLRKEGRTKLDAIGDQVQNRLWNARKLDE